MRILAGILILVAILEPATARAQQTFTITVLAEQWTTSHHPFTWTTAGHSNSSCNGTSKTNGTFTATTNGNSTNGNVYTNGSSNSTCSSTFTPPSSQSMDIQKPVVYILAESSTARMVLSCTKQVRFGSQCEGLNPGTFAARLDSKGHFEVQATKGNKDEWIRFDVVQQSTIQHEPPSDAAVQPERFSGPAASTIESPTRAPESPTTSSNLGFASRWKSMMSGSIHVLRFSGDYLYIEAILPETAAKAGAFTLSELKRDPATGGYIGKTNARVVSDGSTPGRSCEVAFLIELTLVSSDRIEGRTMAPPVGSKINWITCQFTSASDWKTFTWIPVE